LGVETVPTRISILADNTRQKTGHAYVQLVINKKEKTALSIWRKWDTAVFKLVLQ
jgi:hypothetical protein